jgi:hypothetical protein
VTLRRAAQRRFRKRTVYAVFEYIQCLFVSVFQRLFDATSSDSSNSSSRGCRMQLEDALVPPGTSFVFHEEVLS